MVPVGRRDAVPVSREQIIGDGIRDQSPDHTQHRPAHEKRPGVRHHLVVDPVERQIVPIEGGESGFAQKSSARPKRRAENGDEGPWIVQKRPGHQSNEVEAERPCAKGHHDHVEPIGRGKTDEDTDRKREGCPVR